MTDNLDRLINWHSPKPKRRAHRHEYLAHEPSRAACTAADVHQFANSCGDMLCPRHAPRTYADCMARHAANYPGENWGGTL